MRTHPLKMQCDGDSARARGLSESSVFARIPHELDQPEHLTYQRMKQSGRTPSSQWTREPALSAAANSEAMGLMFTFVRDDPPPARSCWGRVWICTGDRTPTLHQATSSFTTTSINSGGSAPISDFWI